MDIITQNTTYDNAFETTIDIFFKKFKVGKLLSDCNCNKEQGIPCITVFKKLFMLVFTGKNLFRTVQLDQIPFGKDVIYRFLNSIHVNWHKFFGNTCYKGNCFVRGLD